MKRALLIGIDTYDNFAPLAGCVNDVNAIKPLLARNEDASLNFHCLEHTHNAKLDRRALLEAIDTLFSPGADVGLLYFAGHGFQANGDVIIASRDGIERDPGIPLSQVLTKIQNSSSVREAIVILDCCFSGGGGGIPQLGVNIAALRQGVAILAASRADQVAVETPTGRGLFSFYLCGALDGGAADVLGKVTLAGLYAYLSESFGPWDQRPTFKANLERLHELRRCRPAVVDAVLRRLPELFPTSEYQFPLDPSYEPDAEPKTPEHEAIFAELQKCRAAKLVEPVGVDHMYFAAMQSTGCRLTPLGKHYWRMAKQGRL
jgi:uncharacterized caspase-like protein